MNRTFEEDETEQKWIDGITDNDEEENNNG